MAESVMPNDDDIKQEVIDFEEPQVIKKEDDVYEDVTDPAQEIYTDSFPCKFCGKVFSIESYCNSHSRICPLRYHRKSGDEEMEENSQEKKYKCTECKYQTDHWPHIRNHMYTHNGHRPFKCLCCDYETTQKGALQRHFVQIHSKEKMFECDKCDYKSGVAANLRLHKRVHLQQKPFVCKICHKSYTLIDSLEHHMYKHNGKEKPFKCDECDYSTLKASHLRVHKCLKHSNEKPFACTTCDYRSATSGQIKRHMKTHNPKVVKKTTEKRFKCTQCKFQTDAPSYMKTHARTHSGQWPHQCSYCDYVTIYGGHLTLHVRIKHTKDRPFKCNKCQYSSSTSSNLNKHKRDVHENGSWNKRKRIYQRFTCKICNSNFALANQLNEHISENHCDVWKIEMDDVNDKANMIEEPSESYNSNDIVEFKEEPVTLSD